MGNVNEAALGYDGLHCEYVPRTVDALVLVGKQVVQVAAGGNHTAVVTSEGEVFTFGAGGDGQLGHGRQLGEYWPRRVDALVGKQVVRVAAGGNHTVVLSTSTRR